MLEILSKKFESPAHEAQERMRFLARKAEGGLKAKLRAARMAMALPDLTDSKAKSYWYASVNDVPSHHMDRLRSLTGAANDNAGYRLPCLSSSSGVVRLLEGLEDRGVIRRLPNRARAITIIAHPAGISPSGNL